MRDLFKKPWFLGILMVGVMLIVLLLNLWILSLKWVNPFADDNFWTLASDVSSGQLVNIYPFIFTIAFYASIIPVLLSGLSIIRKSNWGLITGIVYFLAYSIVLIIFQVLNHYLSLFALILIILSVILLVGALGLYIIRNIRLKLDEDQEVNEKEVALKETNIPLFVLIIDIVSILILFSMFVIPVYSVVSSGDIYNAILVNVLFLGDTTLETLIYFLVNFALLLGGILYFANCLSSYIFDKERFIELSKTFIVFSFIVTLMYFFMGLVMTIYHTIDGSIAQTYAFIPLFLMIIMVLAHAVYKGKFNALYQIKTDRYTVKYAKIEPLLYIILLTITSAVLLLLYVIKIDITSLTYNDSVKLTGLDVLRDYASLDPGYRIVAYILVVMLISSGLTLVIAMSSYLSKYKEFHSVVKAAAAINIFFIFMIAISGYYFQIGQQIDQAVIINIFDFYGISVPSAFDYEYVIRTDAIYALIAATAVIVVMFIRKAFDKQDLSLADASVGALENAQTLNETSTTEKEINDDVYYQFDPCPGFSELDEKIEAFKADVDIRKQQITENTTLNELVNFVVEYARNSRLHLSYTPEDIATFVAGLGASKLSILQGMSGTGKTSLPKIFSEAIFGNCEIVEVESSWKDKNELLGYYNEFSMKYTPKKFTLALYKAALNQDIFTFILLDEMNLSRIEYYFSDFLSLMENEEGFREIKLLNINLQRKVEGEPVDYVALDHGHTLKVPSNVWFIGTANRDESTFVISDKVYDRAQTMNFTKRAPKVRNYSHPIPKQFYDYQTIQSLFDEAKSNGDFDAENNETIKQIEVLLAPYNISFGNRILKQIEDFVNIYKACFTNEDVEAEAIEKILLSKVVSKLEVKTIDDKEKLEIAFEKLNLLECLAFIRRLDNE